MGFLKALFGSSEETPEEREKAEQAKRFDLFKYDGVKAARIGKFDYAVQCYRAALEIHDDPELHEFLATALLNSGHGDEAVEELKRLTEVEPENTKVWLRLAHFCFLEDDYGQMKEAAGRALEIEPQSTDALFALAQAAIGQGDNDQAVELLTQAIGVRDDFGDAWLLRGRTLLKMGKTEEAKADAEHLLEVAPDHEDVLLLKAAILEAEGDESHARDIYNKVLELNPFNVEALKVVNPEAAEQTGSAGTEQDIEQKTKDAYKNTLNPFGF